MSPAISTHEAIHRDRAFALSVPGAPTAGRSAERPGAGTGLDWLQDALYNKLVCRDGTLSAPVKLAQRLLAFAELNELISRIETIEPRRSTSVLNSKASTTSRSARIARSSYLQIIRPAEATCSACRSCLPGIFPITGFLATAI